MKTTKLINLPTLLIVGFIGSVNLLSSTLSAAEANSSQLSSKYPQQLSSQHPQQPSSQYPQSLSATKPNAASKTENPSVSEETQAIEVIEWSEDTLYEKIKAAELAAQARDWQQAIDVGEQALQGCLVLKAEKDPSCILIMKNNIVAYNQAGQVLSHAKKIEHAYRLAQNELNDDHYSTRVIREVFHKLLLEQVRYVEAIPVVIDLIDAERNTNNDEFEILNWYIQLYALYKVEGMTANEVPTLERMLKLTDKLIGKQSSDYKRVAKSLAETYCAQEMYYEFYTFVRKQRLKISCKNNKRK